MINRYNGRRIFNYNAFGKSLKLYQDELKDSGFSNDLHYIENNNNTSDKKRKKKRKIIWFNPPFSNIDKIFLQLLSKHFPKNQKMHNIFNRNTIKYYCMKNILFLFFFKNLVPSVTRYYGQL